MTASAGRSIALTWNAVAVAGVREKGIAMAGEPIDVTSDEDAGWRTLLTVAGQNEVTVTISGVTKSSVLREDWFAGTRTRALVITYPDGGELSGNFYLSAYTDTGPYNDAATFEATLVSTGAVTYDPPTA